MNPDKFYNIFLADDDEDDTFLFQEALEQLSLSSSLVTAENGLELMKKLNSSDVAPDMIFLDMNMPVKNGLECLSELRATETFRQTPVIILSTSVAGYLLESAYNAGANLYVQKPTSFSSLISILEQCLSKKSDFTSQPDINDFLVANNN
ncbi:response regulator [Dyadobacter subterraneus]|uniref:Response regulator n=1 Tax=Dyadobacter subterraneus TaxID=2773304 RepID=A0ABR9W797_9BACT|nr:response regulator [Dyadobacter subterraneus]MBE9460266.1 response regulator [Dyadobacter subterraneus]